MRVAIVGSRTLTLKNFDPYLPENTRMIISGGANGIDKCAANYAISHNIELIEIKPDYKKYGKAAPIKRNSLIIDAADMILVFWDGKSRGSFSVINESIKKHKELNIYLFEDNNFVHLF